MKEDKSKLIREFLKQKVFAVVGASRDPKKYGHQVYINLKRNGYEAYPINPKTDQILGNKCYPNIASLPKKPDVVDIVVPPKITENIVKECKELGITRIWMQPGSESEGALEFCRKNKMKVLYGICVIMESKKVVEK